VTLKKKNNVQYKCGSLLHGTFLSFEEGEKDLSSPCSLKRRFCFNVSFIARTALRSPLYAKLLHHIRTNCIMHKYNKMAHTYSKKKKTMPYPKNRISKALDQDRTN